MSEPIDLQSVLTEEEQHDMLRETVIHFLSRDPLHPCVDFFGQALADLYQTTL